MFATPSKIASAPSHRKTSSSSCQAYRNQRDPVSGCNLPLGVCCFRISGLALAKPAWRCLPIVSSTFIHNTPRRLLIIPATPSAHSSLCFKMGKRKRQPQGTGVIIPDALADAFENFLKGVPSELKNDAAPVLESWEASSEPAEMSARIEKIDVC